MEAFLELFFGGRGDYEQLPRSILLNLLDILKSCSIQVGFDFGNRKNSKKSDLENTVVVGPRDCCACPEKSSLMELTNGVLGLAQSKNVSSKHSYEQRM